MRVCLLSPPTITDFDPAHAAGSELVRTAGLHPPLGVLTLAAMLEGVGIAPRVVHVNGLYAEYIRSPEAGAVDFCGYAAGQLEPLAFDVFGFSTICCSYPLTVRLAREVKRTHPKAAIVFGGPQASAVDEVTVQAFPFVDAVVRGEAEESFPRLLEALAGRGGWDGVAGITFRRNGRIVRNRDAPLIRDLDALPPPAFHLYPELRESKFAPVEVGRGCPFGCTFCSTSRFFRRRFRLKSPRRVVEQMLAVRRKYGIERFDFVHDMFTVDRKRVVAYCEALLGCGVRFRWHCSARTDCVDDELIALMARAGCRGIFFGVETGSPRLQRVIGKNLDLDEAVARIRRSGARRIRTTVSLITAFPEETPEDLERTVEFFMGSLRFDRVEPQLHLLDPLAGTKYHLEYRGRLELNSFSDLSATGWRQQPEDRALIEAHPDIFPNFYAAPVRGLDLAALRELRDFLLNGAHRFRWLMLALDQDSGGMLRVFELWRQWRGCAGDPDYYGGIRFRDDFLAFVRSRYLDGRRPGQAAISALLEYEAGAARPAGGGPNADGNPRLRPGVRVIELAADYKSIIDCLRKKRGLEQVRSRPVVVAVRPAKDGRVEVVQLNEPAARLLRLCDGTNGVDAIARQFAGACQDLRSASPHEACLFGLEFLRRRRLIEWPAGAQRR